MSSLFLSVTAVLALAGPAAAASVVTTPVLNGVAGGGFTCNVVNVSSGRQQVRIEILPSQGEPTKTPLLPGDITGVTVPSSQGEQAYCRVTASGRRGGLRVSLEARSAGFPSGQPLAVVQGE